MSGAIEDLQCFPSFFSSPHPFPMERGQGQGGLTYWEEAMSLSPSKGWHARGKPFFHLPHMALTYEIFRFSWDTKCCLGPAGTCTLSVLGHVLYLLWTSVCPVYSCDSLTDGSHRCHLSVYHTANTGPE